MANVLREGPRSRERPDGALPAQRQAAALPHICFVAPLAWSAISGDARVQVIGGAEVQQALLARLFARNGYRVSMVCLDFGQPERVSFDGVTVHKAYRPQAGLPVLRFFHPRLTSIWRALREVDADIYYHRSSSMLTGVMADFCRRYGKRAIYAGASDVDFDPDNDQLPTARDRWLFRYGLRNVDAIVVQNARQARVCRQQLGREPLFVPSCYEPPANARIGGGDLVLWVGTMNRAKRPDVLLDMAERLPHRRFVMVGGAGIDRQQRAEYYEGLRSRARSLPNVEFTGFLPLAQVEPWFDRARVLVNSSFYEGMPNTFLQAWARGVPTTSTVDVGAQLHGKPLYRVAPDAAGLASEVERLFDDDLYWRESSRRSLEYFRAQHSSERALELYARLFGELSARKAAR